jgi:hypothetical protein
MGISGFLAAGPRWPHPLPLDGSTSAPGPTQSCVLITDAHQRQRCSIDVVTSGPPELRDGLQISAKPEQACLAREAWGR